MSSQSSWKISTCVPYTWKYFVRESETNEESISSGSLCFPLSGSQCREAYEEALSVPSESSTLCKVQGNTTKTIVRRRPVQPPHLNQSRWINALMKEASVNNVEGIVNLLNKETDFNVTDQFGWTMLMCACHAGALDVVRYLLENGADTHVRDKSGYTCISLAKRQKHSAILHLLESKTNPVEKPPITTEDTTQIFCDICQEYFEESCTRLHRNTTIHLFNSHPRKHTTCYGIPESNKGFELMIKNGWDRDQGLGPEGSGTKFPLKTILKRDRKGFGVDKGVARVTHFKSHDIRAIETRNKRETKYRNKEKIPKKLRISSEKQKERCLRRELNF